MKQFLPILVFSILIISCMSPSRALEKGNYKSAFNLASNQIKYEKNIEENILICKISSAHLVQNELDRNAELEKSQEVKDWITVQNRYYDLLEDLGRTNIMLHGEISESYDNLCEEKKDIDYKIADHYFQMGLDYLSEHDNTGTKELARKAYYKFKKAKKKGGEIYFNDLGDLMSESLNKGIVYYISSGVDPSSSLFFKPLPKNADFKPDCDIYVRYGSIHTDEDETRSSQSYSKEIVVGEKSVTDTSGVTTYEPIFETIKATVHTIKVSVTLKMTTYVEVDDLTGQCSVTDDMFTTEVSDSYEEIKIEGNKDALDHVTMEKTGEPAFFISNLEDDLEDEAQRKLFGW